MKTRLLIAASAAALSACATVEQPTVGTGVAYQLGEAGWLNNAGKNVISGSALLRTVGGDVRTCAGFSVQLIPSSPYADARMRLIFPDGAFRPAYGGSKVEQADGNYENTVRATTCDAQGNFAFRDLPDGTYYVTAQVTWGVPQRYFTSTEGGMLMRKVSVAGGRTENIVLTR